MLKEHVKRVAIATLVIAMLASLPAASLQAAPSSVPALQTVLEAKTVQGSLAGGEFAKVWLGLDPDFPEAPIQVKLSWDRNNAANNGVGFFVLDEVGLNRAIAGTRLQDVATAGGSPIFEGADNEMDANFTSFGLTRYTIVVFNDSSTGANFTASVTNGTLIDDSGQVTDPNAPAESEEGEGEDAEAAPEAETAAAEAPVAEAPAAEAPAAEAPAAEAAVEEAPVAEEIAPEPEAAAAPSGPANVARADELDGDLTPGETHYIGLTPKEKDGQIELNLTFDPRDDTDLARRINFFVLRAEDLAVLSGNTRPSDLAVAAGNRVFGGESNLRRANFQATGTGEYTLLVLNSSGDKTAQYNLAATNGILIDDAGQTKTAQSLGGSDDAEDTADDTADEAPAEAAAPAPAPAAAPATTTTTTQQSSGPSADTAVAGSGDYAPGGVYVITSGDTLGIVAREAYGDVLFYRQVCAFNSIADCNRVEIGDEIQLPTLAQLAALGDNPTAVPAAERPEPESTPEPQEEAADEEPAEEEPAEEAAEEESAAEEDEEAAEDESAADDGEAASEDDLLETAISTEDFNVLVAAIEAAGLEDALKGDGPLTVFAPTDAAFASLPDGVLDRLLRDPGGQLTDVLLYHVVPGKLMAADLSDGDAKQTVQGSDMTFNETSSGFNINNDANIIITDIEASNGVIHVIDGVIQPTGESTSSGSSASADESDAADDSSASDDAGAEVDLQGIIENLPVLDDAFGLTSESTDDSISVSYQTESGIEDAAEFYQDEMERNGFTTTRSVVAPTASTLKFEQDNATVQVGITEEDDNSLVTLTVEGQ